MPGPTLRFPIHSCSCTCVCGFRIPLQFARDLAPIGLWNSSPPLQEVHPQECRLPPPNRSDLL